MLKVSCNNHAMLNSPIDHSKRVLIDQYSSDINNGKLSANSHQKEVIFELQVIYNHLINNVPLKPSPFSKLILWHSKTLYSSTDNQGLYLWGKVGRGKTFIVNYFFKQLPIKKKLRLHFYRFMLFVHEELAELKNVSDPLKAIASGIAKKANLLYLDEFFVNDITDAMLLGRLFEYLFDLGVVLITTSNTPINELYKDGLQREHFLPTIILLKKYTNEVNLGGTIDYRLKNIENNDLYFITTDKHDELSEQRLANCFKKLSGVELHNNQKSIIINQQHIPVKKWADDIVWFSFDEICNRPRSATDYIQIAKFFHTVLISDIPVMNKSMDDAARRFIIMVDEFYNSNIILVLSAKAAPKDLYTSTKLNSDFKRTISRLQEMQSIGYRTKTK